MAILYVKTKCVKCGAEVTRAHWIKNPVCYDCFANYNKKKSKEYAYQPKKKIKTIKENAMLVKNPTKNNFSEYTRFIFSEAHECWNCGCNKADALHHIVGRGGDGDEESSPLNAAPICNHKCHLPEHGVLGTENKIRYLLSRTYEYLTLYGYHFTEKDSRFIKKYVTYYS